MKTLVLFVSGLTLLHVVEARRFIPRKCIGRYVCQRQSFLQRQRCIMTNQICDGYNDCPMAEDEANCPCDLLVNPLNGYVETQGLNVGNKALYSCYQGYTLNGNSERTCMQTRRWNGTLPSCSPDEESCQCDNKREIGDVNVPLDNTTDHLTMEQFNTTVEAIDYQGMYEFVDPSRNITKHHFGLAIRLSNSDDGTLLRNLSYSTERDNTTCIKCSGTMEQHGDSDLAIHLIGGGCIGTRSVSVHFSSCPDQYVWEMICFRQGSNITLETKTCPVENTVIFLKVNVLKNGSDQLPMAQIERDLFVNTGLNFCQISDLPSWFIKRDFPCDNDIAR